MKTIKIKALAFLASSAFIVADRRLTVLTFVDSKIKKLDHNKDCSKINGKKSEGKSYLQKKCLNSAKTSRKYCQ